MQPSPKARRQVEKLSWRYFDDVMEPDEFKQLEDHLRDQPDARKIYIDCAMLHAHLIEYFRGESPPRFYVANDKFLSHLLDENVDAPKEAPVPHKSKSKDKSTQAKRR